MPAPLADQQILDAFRVNPEKTLTLKELAKFLGVAPDGRAFLRKRVRQLVHSGHLRALPLKRFGLAHLNEQYQGYVRRNPKGFGWFIADAPDIEDAFISPPAMAGLFDGDRISAVVYQSPKGWDAQIHQVLERGRERITGTYLLRGKAHMVQPDPTIFDEPILITGKGLGKQKGLFPGVLVEVQMLSFPTDIAMASGEITAVLGVPGELSVEVQKSISASGVTYEFPPEVLEQAAKHEGAIPKKAKSGRKDLTALPLCTIDGATAKDFDDAVYAKREGENIRVHVAIADVAHYVVESTSLDTHALERSTSLYYPGHCIPMLPETLSNGMCSLKPNCERLCMVAEVVLGVGGAVKEAHFYEAVMRSHQRLTYTQVQAFFEHDAEAIATIEEEIRVSLVVLRDAAQRLRKVRKRRGTMDLDVPEPVIHLDEEGLPVAIHAHPRVEAHRVIEELMIMANEAVARYFSKKKRPTVYRVHESPDAKKLETLFAFVRRLGSHLGDVDVEDAKNTQMVLQQIASSMQNHPAKDTVLSLVLRAMMQARYSSNNRGHFGLASGAYLHFTSPIRRYPDLIVHRLLKKMFKGEVDEKDSAEALENLAMHCSNQERRAIKCERDINDIYTVWYMQDKVGEVFSGRVVSVTDFGLFVRLNQHFVDGMVHLSTLGGGPIEKDEWGLGVHAPRSGFQIRVGDPVVVEVVNVDLVKKHIDFILREPKPTNRSTLPTPAEPWRSAPKKKERLPGRSTGWSPLGTDQEEVTPEKDRAPRRKKKGKRKSNTRKKKKGKVSKSRRSTSKGNKRR